MASTEHRRVAVFRREPFSADELMASSDPLTHRMDAPKGARGVVCDNSGWPAPIVRDEHGKAQFLYDYEGAEVVPLDEQRPHAVGHIVCRECGHHHVGVVDARADLDALQCSSCNEMTARMQPDPPGEVVQGPWPPKPPPSAA
jgi:hypothetical protein